MHRIIKSLFVSIVLVLQPLHAATTTDFVGPTERFLSTTKLDKIKPHLKEIGIDKDHVVIMDQAIHNETLGFFGYHGARREYVIFQDIIRYGIEEVLGIPIRPDFHFLRIPGLPELNVNDTKTFFKDHQNGINDNLHMDKMRLLSINISLYSLYLEKGEFSLHYFSQNTNITKRDFEEVLIPFFIMMGVDPSYIHQAYDIGEKMLSRKSGLLMQFFDNSNYEMTDKQAYLSLIRGVIYKPNDPLSHLLMNPNQKNFPQARLLLNNRVTLNPYSPLSVYRYTLTKANDFEKYQDTMRKYFQSLPVDESQKEIYRAQLLKLWDQS